MSTFDAWSVPEGVFPAPPPAVDAMAGTLAVTVPEVDEAAARRLLETLQAARAALLERSATEIAESLGRVGARFLDPADPLRVEALPLVASAARLSPEMSAAVLDGMARDWTAERLTRLLQIELGDPRALDDFAPRDGRVAMAVGPSLCVQIVAGSVPGVGVTALLRSLLVKAPTLLKPGRGDIVLPTLFRRALAETDPDMAEAVGVLYWPGGESRIETEALHAADVAVVYGSDDTVAAVRAAAAPTTRVVEYRHRVSLGVVGVEALDEAEAAATAGRVATSVAFFDQRGCVSPQVVFVEVGGEIDVRRFSAMLAAALGDLERSLPSGAPDVGVASAIQQLRGTAELLTSSGEGAIHHGGSEAPWTVVLDPPSGAVGVGSGRVVQLRRVSGLDELVRHVERIGVHAQTLAATGLGARLAGVAKACGRVGVTRVVPFESAAFPPPWWHHDGRGPLTELVRWVDLETGPEGR